ncbi:Mas-related G-protein coupled receptor member [Trichinella pseudospiralis]
MEQRYEDTGLKFQQKFLEMNALTIGRMALMIFLECFAFITQLLFIGVGISRRPLEAFPMFIVFCSVNSCIIALSMILEHGRRFYLANSNLFAYRPMTCLYASPHLITRIFGHSNFLLTALLISVERLLALYYPMWHKRLFSERQCRMLMCLIACSSIMVVILLCLFAWINSNALVSPQCSLQQTSYTFTLAMAYYYLIGDSLSCFTNCILLFKLYRRRSVSTMNVSIKKRWIIIFIMTNIILAFGPDVVNLMRLCGSVKRGVQRLGQFMKQTYAYVLVVLYFFSCADLAESMRRTFRCNKCSLRRAPILPGN